MMSARKIMIMVGGLLLTLVVQYYFGDLKPQGTAQGKLEQKKSEWKESSARSKEKKNSPKIKNDNADDKAAEEEGASVAIREPSATEESKPPLLESLQSVNAMWKAYKECLQSDLCQGLSGSNEGDGSRGSSVGDPRAKERALAQEFEKILQRFLNDLLERQWQDSRVRDSALDWLGADAGEIKQKALEILLSQPRAEASVPVVIEQVIQFHDGNLVSVATKELTRHLEGDEPKSEALIQEAVIQALERGSLLVKEKLIKQLALFFTPRSISFYKRALKNPRIDLKIKQQLDGLIKEWERHRTAA